MLLIILLFVSIAFIVISTTKFKLHPFIALLLAAIGFGLFSGMPLPEIVKSVNGGFGTTIGYIGIDSVINQTVIDSTKFDNPFLDKSLHYSEERDEILTIMDD